MGYDFALGKGREGDAARLTANGQELGYSVEVIPAVSDESGVISSTEIRKLVGVGDVAEAADSLDIPTACMEWLFMAMGGGDPSASPRQMSIIPWIK